MAFILLTVLFNVIIIETLHREGFQKALQWIVKKPLDFIGNIAIILSCVCLMNFFIKCINVSISIISFIFLVFGLINEYKLRFRGDPLFPWDLGIKKEGSNMVMLFGDLEALFKIVGIFLFSIISCLWPYPFTTIFQITTILFVIGILLLLGIGLLENTWKPSNTKMQDLLYFNKGVILAFAMNIIKMIWTKKKFKKHNNKKSSLIVGESREKGKNNPNIIMIMNESFWDPSVMENVKFSKDPAPTIKALRETFTHGNLVVPDFGGGTSNIEFEVMTGLTMNFLPTGSMAFRYISKPIFSLPNYFRSIGYETIGIHSYKRWFWERERVYKILGFNEFISDESFKDPQHKGLFISDLEFSKKVIEITEQNMEKPLFIYGVTMQNHGPYSLDRYNELDIEVENKNLTKEQKKQLEIYTQGIYDADQGLQYLIEYFSKAKQPTIIFFFGDHLPMLGKKFSTFHAVDYIHTTESVRWTREEQLKMYGVPLVTWSNFPREKKDLGHISSSFLGIELFDAIGMEKPSFLKFLSNIYQQQKVITNRIDSLYLDQNKEKNIIPRFEEYEFLHNIQLF